MPTMLCALLALAAALTGCATCAECDEDGQARLDPVVDALDAYRADHGTYPDSVAALVPGYLQSLPAEPEWTEKWGVSLDGYWEQEGLPRERWWGYRADTTAYNLGFLYADSGMNACRTSGQEWTCDGYF